MRPTKAMIASTKTMTTTKNVNSSLRVGLTTFFSSAITWRTNSAIRAKRPRFLVVPSPARPARSGLPEVVLADSLTGGLPHWSGCRGRGRRVDAAAAGQEGLEPTTAGFGDRCATNCATALRDFLPRPTVAARGRAGGREPPGI